MCANAAFERLTGAPARAAEGWFAHDGAPLALPPDRAQSWRGEVSFGPGRRAQGILSVTPVVTPAAEAPTFVCSLTDITEQKRVQAELDHLAMHDALTGLPNRRALDAALAALSGPAALAILDLDAFKDVNDSYGHLTGDVLLREVGERLAAQAAPELFRIGGDEFAILWRGLAQEEDLRAAVGRMRAALALPFSVGAGREVALGASWGASLIAEGPGSVLFAQADAALHERKSGERDALGIYEERFTEAAQRRLALGARLRRAIDAEAIEIAYQPQVDRAGAVTGLEALARWTDPELGPIAPAEFIPLAEAHGLIFELGDLVLRRACADGARWRAEGVHFGTLAVNVSAVQLRLPGLPERVEAILHETGFPAGALELELTESAFLGPAREVQARLERLKAAGVRLAVDDFGTGYSALSYLPRLPLDTLKIDRSFVSRALGDARARALIGAIAQMARGLELRVVAEGVETEAQAAFLREIGCDAVQGFFFARPGAASAVAQICAARRGAPALP